MSNADISLEGLSVTEKLGLMERIWTDLEQQAQSIPSPDWHGDILARRLQAVQNGEVEFLEWSQTKKLLRQRHA